MSLSSINNFFANSTSFFSFNKDNKTLTGMQSITAAYANGAFHVRRETTLDILDLSAEGRDLSKLLTPTNPMDATEPADDVLDPTATDDVTLGTPNDISEQQRVEMIRVNKNSVLERVKDLLSEKGLEVPDGQKFDLRVNFLDGTIEATGIDDPELAAQFNEALQGDGDLIARMRKTRDELGIPDRENTVPRNFTIGFDSMLATPEDAELEYNIDVYVHEPIQVESETAAVTDEESEQAAAEESSADQKKNIYAQLPTFQYSIMLTNKPKQAPTVVDLIEEPKKNDETKSKDEEEEEQLGTDPLDENEEDAAA